MNSRSLPSSLQRQLTGYDRLVEVRNYLLRPVAMLCTRLGITPLMVTIGGLLLMLAFAVLLPSHPYAALVCGVISVLSDALDGVLARYQKLASDRGKLIDITFDSVIFTVFVIGLVRVDILSGVIALALVTTMALSRLFRVMVHAQYLPTDWRFRAVAGFLPIALAFVLYALFPLFLITGLNVYAGVAFLSSIVLLFDAARHFKHILDR